MQIERRNRINKSQMRFWAYEKLSFYLFNANYPNRLHGIIRADDSPDFRLYHRLDLLNTMKFFTITHKGKTLTLSEWSKETGIAWATLRARLRYGRTSEKILETPVQLNHNLSKTPEYKSWEAMRNRCNNSKSENFKEYGGRGIPYVKDGIILKTF